MGAGNNAGIRQARGRYVCVLNPDTMAFPDTFAKLIAFMDKNPRAGIVGPKLINPDGTLQYTRCRFPQFLTPVFRRTPLQRLSTVEQKLNVYLTKDEDYNSPQTADWLYGACLCIRREVLEKIGLFDERFFLGFEDTDLCRRVWQAGFEVWYYPESVLVHYPNRFSGSSSWLKSLFNQNVRIHIISWLKYFWKWRKARNVKPITHNG